MNSKDLRNIASVYEAVYGGAKKEEKKPTDMVVTNADKKANTKAYQNLKAGVKGYKAADHLGEESVDEGYAKPNKSVPKGSKVGPKKVSAPKGSKVRVKRWWDDDGDGIGYEKGEVKKEQNELVSKEVKDLQKAAKTGKGKYAAKADKLAEDKDTPDQVAAVIDMYRSKKGTGEAVKDTEEGKKKAAKKERDYAAWEREKMKQDDPDWKHKKGSTTESVDADYIEIVREIKSAETQADIKRWGALEESGNFSDQELAIIIEADIADILARLEKKRISKGGDPEESPLPAMRKYHADKKKKKVKEEVEIDEGIVRAIKKAKRIGKRILDAHDSDPGRAHTIGTLGNPNVRNDEKAAERRKNQKKYRGVKVKEEFELDEAERSLLDKIMEADSLAGQVARWEAARQKRMKQRQSYERPSWIPRDQDHEDNWGSSKGEKKKG